MNHKGHQFMDQELSIQGFAQVKLFYPCKITKLFNQRETLLLSISGKSFAMILTILL